MVAVGALVTLAACSARSTPSEPEAQQQVDAPLETREASATTSSTSSGTPAAPPTTGTTIPTVLPPCAPDMGSTLQAQHLDVAWSSIPGVVRDVPEEGFDWNQDGNPDRLVIGDTTGSVTIDWGNGSLTVTDVHTDFTVPITDEDGVEHVARSTVGPGTDEERTRQLADRHRPAAVIDVTGDGWLDLVVTHRGTAAVLAGSGDQTPTGSIGFDRVGLDTPGWRSPPVRGPHGLRPTPVGDVDLWTTVGRDDGVDGFSVGLHGDRIVRGPGVLYAGVPCTTRPG